MLKVEFYSSADGTSELWDFLIDLEQKGVKSKDARIQHKQIIMYIQLLEDHGTRLGEKIAKHLDSVKKRKKHLAVRSKRQKPNATIGFPERGEIFGNLV